MSEIVILSGSPFESSRSDQVLRYLGRLLQQKGFQVTHISVRDVPHNDLFFANFNSPVIEKIAKQIRDSSGIIVGSPVYKAAFSGVLKTLIDILPQEILEGKPVLPLMTGGSKSHLLALEFSLKPLLATLKGQNLKGIYLTDQEVDKESLEPILDIDTLARTKKQLDYFTEIIKKQSNPIPEHYTI